MCTVNMYLLSSPWLPLQSLGPDLESYESHQSPVITSDEDKPNEAGDSQFSVLPSTQVEQQDEQQPEDGYELMTSIGSRGSETSSPESPKPSVVVLKEASSPSLGGTVNLIFSFGNTGDSQVQVLDSPARTDEVVEKTSEPVHRVRTHTHHFTLEVTIEGLHIFSSPKSTERKFAHYYLLLFLKDITVTCWVIPCNVTAWDLPP